MTAFWTRYAIHIIVTAALTVGCASTRKPAAHPTKSEQQPTPPDWVLNDGQDDQKLCGVGVAGAGFNELSPYPKELSKERAIRNLAGILGTTVEEAIIDTTTDTAFNVQTARAVHVNDDLVKEVEQLANTEFWLDTQGQGPFAQKNFTYARACMDAAQASAQFKLNYAVFKKARDRTTRPEDRPTWLDKSGVQAGGRLCAVGFSLPMFHADKTFEGVIEDVRGQLAEVISTLVSSYYEELTNNRTQIFEAMTVASTQAIAKGVIVTHYWFDKRGQGPYKKKLSTYGWGCVYPVDVMRSTVAAVEKVLPEKDKEKVIARVRERAENAFEELEKEVDKHQQTSPMSPKGADAAAVK